METWKLYDKAMQNIKAVMQWIQISIIGDLWTQEAKIAENVPKSAEKLNK